MKFLSLDVDLRELFIGNFNPFWIFVCIEFTRYYEIGFSSCVCDKVDEHSMSYQRFATPVLSYIREQPLFDFVPFACAWQKVTY